MMNTMSIKHDILTFTVLSSHSMVVEIKFSYRVFPKNGSLYTDLNFSRISWKKIKLKSLVNSLYFQQRKFCKEKGSLSPLLIRLNFLCFYHVFFYSKKENLKNFNLCQVLIESEKIIDSTWNQLYT